MNDKNSLNPVFCVTDAGALILSAATIGAVLYCAPILVGKLALPYLHSAAGHGLIWLN